MSSLTNDGVLVAIKEELTEIAAARKEIVETKAASKGTEEKVWGFSTEMDREFTEIHEVVWEQGNTIGPAAEAFERACKPPLTAGQRHETCTTASQPSCRRFNCYVHRGGFQCGT